MTRNRITTIVRQRNAPLAESLWRFSGRAHGVALACAALAWGPMFTGAALAQQDTRDQQSGDQSENQSGGWLKRAWGQVKPEDQPQTQPSQQAQPAQQPLSQPAPPAAGARSEEMVQISASSEPVNVGLLVDFIAKQLDVNIISDPGLNDQTVIFNGGLSVPRDELLALLSMLLEQRGYALTADRPGWYVIKQVGNLPVVFGNGPLATTRVIKTPLIRPSSLQDAVSKTLGVTEGQAGRVAYLDDLGVLIITNTPRNIQAVEDLVAAIAAERDSLALHRFELMNLSADVAREKVLSLLAGVQGGQTRSPTQPLGEGNQRGAVQVGGGQSTSLSNLPDRLFVDGSSNALIFRGTATEADSLVEIIGVVDMPTRLKADRYAVGPAAVQIAQFGEDAGLGPVRYSGNTNGQNRSNNSFGGFNPQSNLNQQRNQQSSTGGPRFVVEDNMEAFVYFGTLAQHEQVKALVDAFAENARGARVVVEFYKLKHADAEQVAELLNALIQDPQTRTGESPFLPQAGFGGSRTRPTIPSPTELGLTDSTGEGAEGEGNALTPTSDITIEPDVARNQIAVRAPARQQREIAKIVDKLDLRRPQVYIEVQIVSVTANDDFRFAIESQFTPGQSVLFTNFGLTSVPEGGSATDPRVVNPNLSGFTSAIIRSDYVPFVINAFQEVGDTRIISSPRILVNDNEEASVESVREEPFAETTQNASTTSTSQGGLADAGTTLTVTPQISDAGMLNLTYELELSDFDRTASVGAGLQPPTQRENYNGVVTLPSDATMVVGGLVRERNNKNVQKVPFIGDIPILGEFFKRTVDSKTQATIYVFITPRIVRDPTFADLRLLTKGPMERVDIKQELPELEPELMPTSGALIAPKRELEPPALDPMEEPTSPEPSAMGPKRLPPVADKPQPMGAIVVAHEKESDGQ